MSRGRANQAPSSFNGKDMTQRAVSNDDLAFVELQVPTVGPHILYST